MFESNILEWEKKFVSVESIHYFLSKYIPYNYLNPLAYLCITVWVWRFNESFFDIEHLSNNISSDTLPHNFHCTFQYSLKCNVTQLIILSTCFHVNKTSITKLYQNIFSLVQTIDGTA